MDIQSSAIRHKKILAVAGPEWQSVLRDAALPFDVKTSIDVQTAYDAVIALATNPTAYHALALDADAGGLWYDTLLDLTLGDTDNAVRLLMLGGDNEADNRLNGTVILNLPVDTASLQDALLQVENVGVRADAELLREAFSNVESIRVRYQPVVRFSDMVPTKVEVLARVAAKNGALIGPEMIINAMSDSEHSMSLTAFIMNLAMAERKIGDFDDIDIDFAFNLPLDAMLHPQLLTLLEAVRKLANIPPNVLRFELTETHPVTDLPELAKVMAELRAAGYRLALDDIIPETPNLNALLNLPFRAVKIDRSVIANAQHYQTDIATVARQFITKITSNAAKTGRAVIAEGIENASTLEMLRALGVTHGQGYHFARPLPARALKPWLTDWANRHKLQKQ